MVTTAHCSCGWRAELSAHYHGRRIRCPDCDCVLNLPGQPESPLYGFGWSAPPVPRTSGQWVPVAISCDPRRSLRGSNFSVVVFVMVVALFSVVKQCRQWSDARPAQPRGAPSEKATPEPDPKEDEF